VLPGDVGRRLPPHFFLLPSYWRPHAAGRAAGKAADAGPEAEALLPGAHAPGSGSYSGNGVEFDSGGGGGGAAVAVAIRGLRRDFATTDGGVKRALDGLSLDIYDGQVTALLGAAAQRGRLRRAVSEGACLHACQGHVQCPWPCALEGHT